eukprot:CAMPEP_0184402452 /NCGR_PEP_ID=MMETSP0007-20130409/82938_1 /TAXON_ID=97485 /ORGANISM="Prymnesium parvum, Strain Texoma1" /LENGTH=91 /DNA_ID=CAMNT_0026758245 /DNA_START=224 /DNA_END=499 /DNA_ORIENTATION=+
MPSRHHESCGPRPRRGDERPEAELLHGDAELGQLRLVHADHVVVRLRDARELVLQLLDRPVLRVEHVVELAGDGAQHVRVEVGRVDHLREL